MPDTRKSYEIIRCADCGREHTRPIEGQLVMPCQRCGNQLLQVWDLEAVLCGVIHAGERSAKLHRSTA